MAHRTLADRFWSKVDRGDPDACWPWIGGLDRFGYGDFRAGPSGHIIAHRHAYEDMVGPIPDGLVIDHLCRNRACCNPGHTEPVTDAENSQRGDVGNKPQSHCKRGHPLTDDNVYVSGRNRACRRCVLDRMKRNYRHSTT